IVGRTQFLNGVQHTIIGVAPEGFLGTFVGYSFQFWVPASMEEIFEAGGYKLENRGARWIEGYAVLKPGVTIEQAQAEISTIAALAAGGGVLVAHWARDLMVLMFPRLPGIVVSLPGEIDTRVLALSAAVCLIATVLFGLVPAMQAGRIDLAAAMKSDAAGVVGGRGRAWIRSSLVLLQVALS